jgi:hypothetical protein
MDDDLPVYSKVAFFFGVFGFSAIFWGLPATLGGLAGIAIRRRNGRN